MIIWEPALSWKLSESRSGGSNAKMPTIYALDFGQTTWTKNGEFGQNRASTLANCGLCCRSADLWNYSGGWETASLAQTPE
jgi:hypothetical protein